MKHRGDIVMANIGIASYARKTTEYNTWILTCTGNIEYHPRKYVCDSNHANCARGIKKGRMSDTRGDASVSSLHLHVNLCASELFPFTRNALE